MKNDIILFGPPAVGKGTQATLLKERCGYQWLSTGDVMRAEIASGSALGKTISEHIDDGNLLPDSMTMTLVQNFIESFPVDTCFVFDGFPRTLFQHQSFAKLYPTRVGMAHIILFHAEHDLIIARMRRRAQKEGRVDDTASAFETREALYEKQTVPIIKWYSDLGRQAIQINTRFPIEDIHTTIKVILDL